MKKFSKFFVLSLCAVFAFNACQKENSVKEKPASKIEMVTASCTIPTSGPDSKVTLSTAGKTRWVVGDHIFIHGGTVNSDVEAKKSFIATVNSVSADGKTAYFDIPADLSKNYESSSSWNSTLFAAYPAEAVSSFTDGTSWYFYNVFGNTNNLLYGGANDKTVNSGLSFSFLPLVGAISFTVDGSSFGGFDSYIFSGNNDEIVSYNHYVYRTAKNSSSVWDNKWSATKNEGPSPTTGGSKTITVTSWGGDDGSTVNTVYFPNPDGFTFTNGFTITFLKDGAIQKVAKVTSSKRIKKGELLNLGDITSHLKTPVIDENHTTLTGDLNFLTATDLSSSASANCYIISAAGQYKFKMVKGNSSTSVGTVKGASIVWETYNNAEDVTANSVVAAVDYYINGDDKYVVFKTPATLKPGNALLAVKDISDNILWSWHIWIPSTTVGTIDAKNTIGGVIMDRNLGALTVAVDEENAVNPLSFGLFYQWGRKDPFPGAKGINKGAATISGTPTEFYAGKIDLATSFSNPTKYASQNEQDWLSETNNDLWKDGEKTMYDPCPPGYRVADYKSDKNFWKHDSSWITLTGGTQSTTYSWYTIGTDAGKVVFPFAGYIDDNGGSYSHTYDRSVIWTSKYSSSSRGYCRDLRGDDATRYSTYKSRGGSVRCVVEVVE